ncbi:hypothetical protein MCHIJ_37140 [Mycolicibacterium chitae]|uniref:non-specific serine/threonine protein kinase n=4 Tax=Mycolicibacterium TaxID=1866885 RepID=A0A448I5X4_MYCCI|nr:serine/threonine-protein kinase PknH/PknJ [Mycolicibacterium chitae]BBZ04277.1 hypothetical protein MCHIJ_37140 [Mycolicibacterium chitae]VEG47918.1 serine/threonine-protein kinase [Mycolicibacterium chitae]
MTGTIGIGSVVSGYRIQGKLGAGGMGTVYAAADPELPRLDALKVMSAELSADPEFRARFRREADIAASLDHPNIVSVYDRGESAEGRLWIAMQLVDGTDADAALRAGTMTPQRAVHIVAAVAEALDYAHSRRVLHRDIKPANFLLSGPVGPEERVLLSDFSIARAADDAGMTATNAVMTTMAYAAPEVLDGRNVDHRSDLYSLGCALFQLLTGRTPFADAPSMAAQAMAHLQRPAPRPSEFAPLTPAFDAVVGTAMAKDPAHRYPSGRALAAAAADALHRQAPPQPRFTPPPPPPRSRTGVKLAAAAGAALLVGAGVSAAVVLRDDPAPAPSAAPTTAAPAPAAVTLADADLPDALLPAEEISAVMGIPMQASGSSGGFYNDRLINVPECTAVMYPAQQSAFQNSGATAPFTQVVNPVDTQIKASVVQSVIAFGTAELARSFVDRQAGLWPGCAAKTAQVSKGSGEPTDDWRLGNTARTDETLTVTNSRVGSEVTCQRALRPVANVVVDVNACLTGAVGDRADTLAGQIADQISSGNGG